MRIVGTLLIVVTVVASLTAGCGEDSAPAAAPSPTTASISVTVDTPIRVGTTAQATGTAALSTGLSQPVTTGWLSDAPNVATVTAAGLVTGVSNGGATIYVISGGRQGQQPIRVVPDYQGTWSGRTVVTSCTHTGTFATVNFCSEFPVGSADGYSLSMAQTGLSLTARLSYGPTLNAIPTVASILGDGTSSFSTTIVDSSGLIITANVVLNSPSVGTLTGTIDEVWTVPGISGEGRLAQNIVGTTRTGSTTLSLGRDSVGNGGSVQKERALERLARWRR